jgi:hypothetical protein
MRTSLMGHYRPAPGAGYSPIDAIDKIAPDKLQLCHLLAGRGLAEAGSPKH